MLTDKPWMYNKDPLILTSPCKAKGGCQPASYRFSFTIKDDKAGNELAKVKAQGVIYPMLQRKFMVEVEFLELKDFDMYHDEVVAVNLFVNSQDNVKSW